MVIDHATANHWTYAVEHALNHLPALFDTKLPGELMDELKKRRPEGEIPPYAGDPRRGNHRWREWSQAFKHMTVRERLRLLWLTIFPPGAFLRQQYHLSPGQPLLPYYVFHFLDGGREAALSLLRNPNGIERPSK